jgi:hypothetical protein
MNNDKLNNNDTIEQLKHDFTPYSWGTHLRDGKVQADEAQ